MKVRSEASKNGQSLAVELTDDDGAEIREDWGDLPLNARVSLLQKHADKLVVMWLARNELISMEFAKQRLKELSS